jgi:hypothetical protein
MLKVESSKSPGREWLKAFLGHPLVVTCYYVGALGLGLAYERIKHEWAIEAIIVGAGVSFALISVNILVSVMFFRIGREKEFTETIRDLKEFLIAQQLGWIVNEGYVRSMEYGSKETWVFSPDLSNDINVGGEIYQAIRANLKEGNRYVYFVPDIPKTYDNIHKYRSLHTFQKDQVQFYIISTKQFLFYTEIVVYNVSNPEEMQAIEWLPQDKLNYYISLGDRQTGHVVGIGRMFLAGTERFA